MNQPENVDLPQKVLIIDDELGNNPSDREDFISDLEISQNLALFASSYDEAMRVIRSNSGIVAAFVDCRIPKSDGLYNFDTPNNEELGLSLIPEINHAHQLAQIIVYSCYVNQSYIEEKLAEEGERYKNIIGFFGKLEGIIQRKKLYLEAVDEVKKLLPVSDLTVALPQKVYVQATADSGFDYSSLDAELAQWLQAQTNQIRSLLRKTTQSIIDTGKYISEVKDRLQFGEYEKWIKNELGLTTTTAWRYMRAHENFDRLDRMGIDNLSEFRIFPSALYQISEEFPDEALIELKSIAESGVKINAEVIKKLAQKYLGQDNELAESDTDSTDDEQEKLAPPIEVKVDHPPISSLPPNLDSPANQAKILDVPNNVVKVLRRQDYWNLGKHKLFRADPNDAKFIEALPNNIALSLVFAIEKNWRWSSGNFHSQMTFYSEYPDLDYVSLLDAVKKIIEIDTADGDPIAVCFCPYPDILRLISELGCQAYIAEPDYDKCLATAQYFLKG